MLKYPPPLKLIPLSFFLGLLVLHRRPCCLFFFIEHIIHASYRSPHHSLWKSDQKSMEQPAILPHKREGDIHRLKFKPAHVFSSALRASQHKPSPKLSQLTLNLEWAWTTEAHQSHPKWIEMVHHPRHLNAPTWVTSSRYKIWLFMDQLVLL